MSDKIFLGQRMAQLDTSPPLEAVSKVVLMVDADNAYVAGTDAGRTVEVTCPYGTQAMANNILAALQSYTYTPAQAQDAILDPAAELGDGLTMGGVYTVLAQVETQWDALMASDAGAPGQAEQESEYSYQSPLVGQLRYQLAETRSLISKTANEIRLEVDNEIQGLSSSFTVQLNAITSRVDGLNGQVSTIQQTVSSITAEIQGINGDISSIEQYVDSITLTVSNGSTSSTIQLKAGSATIASQTIQMNGLVTFTGLADGTTTINGGCIKTGLIDADRLNLTGAITFGDLSSSVQNDINDAYSMAEDAQTTANDTADTVGGWTYRGTTYIDGTKLMTGTVTASTLEGGEIYLLDGAGNRAGSFTLEGASSYSGQAVSIDSGAIALEAQYGAVYLSGGGGAFIDINTRISCGDDITPSRAGSASCGTAAYPWSDVYAETGEVSTSDETLKNSIELLPDKYVTMLDQIMPKRYKINNGTSGRYHVGFIAQDVELAMALAGVDALEFGGWIKDEDQSGNPIYMLRYTEFIAILWAKIKQLEDRLEAMV